MSSGSLRASGELVRAYGSKHGEANRGMSAVHGKHSKAVLQQCSELAVSARSVLLCGETGTGKTLVANLLHAQRAQAVPLKLINCAALSDALLADLMAELADDQAGAALERTVLLDEIGELSPWGQAVLLRHLQHGFRQGSPLRVRFLAATHRDLDAMIAAGAFSRELVWRLNMARITLAPLRARPDEIEPLALHFLRLGLRQAREPFVSLDPALTRCLQAYDWPGNVRELKNAMFGALAVNESGTLSALDLPDAVRNGAGQPRRKRLLD